MQRALALVAASGFALSALAESTFVLGLSRFIAGAGVGAGLMAMLKVHSQWYPKERVAAVTGAGIFVASMGGLTATLPAQAVLPVIGWRGIFWVLAALGVAVSVWISLSVPEPPAHVLRPQRRRLTQEIAEFGRIFTDRPFLRLLPAIAVLSAVNFTYQGLWAGPWLRDAAGLADAPRATVLLCYALGMMIGSLLTGQAASFAQARWRMPMLVPFLGVAGSMAMQAVLIAAPQDQLVLGLVWFLFSFFGSVAPAAYAAMGQGFPPELAGRVATAINGSMLVLVFVLQNVIGWVLDLWPRTEAGGWDPAGYGWAIGLTLALQAAGLAWVAVARPRS